MGEPLDLVGIVCGQGVGEVYFEQLTLIACTIAHHTDLLGFVLGVKQADSDREVEHGRGGLRPGGSLFLGITRAHPGLDYAQERLCALQFTHVDQ
ncbi:hypothetical protein D9M71_516710 [compost metagenome]